MGWQGKPHHSELTRERFLMQPPYLGQPVTYVSKNGDGVRSPAIVLRTQKTTVDEIVGRWLNSLSETDKPPAFVEQLESPYHVDLLVHGLGGDYREYNIGMEPAITCVPGSWHYQNYERG